MSQRSRRGDGQSRTLAWTAVACITASLLVLIGISVAGPSISEPAMRHPPSGPPWWVSLNLPGALVLFMGWGAVIAGAVGILAGLAVVARNRGSLTERLPRLMVIASLVVTAVFTVLPAAGSSDAQSYAIDGTMAVMGHSPYVDTPAQMAALGESLAVNGPATWQQSLSDYGPLATGEEWLSAELGGGLMAGITFWLKLWIALAFAGVVLLLDRLLRPNPAMRLRAHLLWSLNPLILWEIVAAGHIDGLAAGLGLAGLAVLRFSRTRNPGAAESRATQSRAVQNGAAESRVSGDSASGDSASANSASANSASANSASANSASGSGAGESGAAAARPPVAARPSPGLLAWPRWGAAGPPLLRCLAAGALLGAAATIKSPFAAFAIGAVWAVRRYPVAIASVLAGWAIVVVPMYVAAGMPAVTVLLNRGNQVTWDNLYQIFYRLYGFARFGSAVAPGYIVPLAMVLCVALAVLLFLRMPGGTGADGMLTDGVPGFPGVAPALALGLAWIFFWPYQRPWYDAMILVLLALYPRSRLDILVIVRLCFAAVTYMESAHLPQRGWLQHTQLFQGEWITANVRLLAVAALIWLCLTGHWQARSKAGPVPVEPPVPEPQPQT